MMATITAGLQTNRWKQVLPICLLVVCGCTAPHYIWPQKDIGSYEINRADLNKRLLIASPDSEFKRAVVRAISTTFQDQAVYVKIIGIAGLPREDANRYSAVVLINTCMGWTIDRTVKQFLDTYGDLPSIIVLTTSDGGYVFPELANRRIDAMSSASVKEDADQIAREIVFKIKRHL